MKMKQTMRRLLVCTLAMVMLAISLPVHTEAKTVALHKVYSQKQINDRIGVIRDYYYNKQKQLDIRTQKVFLYHDTFTITYYVHGKDLMFGYGVRGKTEYRLYFYKNQLVQMLVDAPGQSRKTYTQMYKKLEKIPYDEKVSEYMDFENYARKFMDRYSSPKNQILDEQGIVITKVSGNTIIYHKLASFGSDGCMWTISKKAYKAKVSANVKIEDYSGDPMTPTYRNMKWLKKQVSSPYFGLAVSLDKKGKEVSKITVMYFA